MECAVHQTKIQSIYWDCTWVVATITLEVLMRVQRNFCSPTPLRELMVPWSGIVTIRDFHFRYFHFTPVSLEHFITPYPCFISWTTPCFLHTFFIYFIRGCAPHLIITLNHDDSILFPTSLPTPMHSINTRDIVACTLTYSWEIYISYSLCSQNLTSLHKLY